MNSSQLRDQVLYTRGRDSYVIRLSEKVYVFSWAGKGKSRFSADSWSFLKFGYFECAEDYPGLPEVLRHIDDDVKALTPENQRQYLCTFVSAEEVKEAWKDFKKRYELC